MQKFSVFLLLVILVFPMLVFATVGVGTTTGKIQVKEVLKAGGIYGLPCLVILNTGNEPSWYGIGVEYHMEQTQLRPSREWFRFDPPEFYLEPKEAQKISIQLIVPIKGKPGDYFAFVEGRSISKEGAGGTARIGVAAAAKLYFTIAPANIFQAIYYRIAALWKKYSPWTWIVSALIVGAILIVIIRALFRKYFSFQIKLKKETKSENGLKTNLESDLKSKPKRRPKRKQRQTK